MGDTSDLFTKLNRFKKNYTVIMSKAQEYMGRGADNVTVYLYSKNGVVISPHEVGYVAATAVALAQLLRLIALFGNRRRRD